MTVLYEIDDYVQSARKIKTHELTEMFDAEFVTRDGAGDARRRRHHLLDRLPRSPLPLVQRAHVGVPQRHRPQALRATPRPARDGRDDRLGRRRRPQGLARALGARAARGPARAARARFVSVGLRPPPRSSRSSAASARSRTAGATIEVYPASMTLFDIAIAPSAENNLFRGKSDLRWLEASALGIPLVAHPDVYPEIEDGVTGVHAPHAGGGRGGAAAARRRPRGARAHRPRGARST